MSMSTPINNLPLKTQHSSDNSDINDPMVQDVLNEFKEEMNITKNNQVVSPQIIPQHQVQSYSSHHDQSVQHTVPQISPQNHMSPPPQFNSHNNSYIPNSFHKYSYDTSYSSYIDSELIIKTLIITIIIIVIHNTEIFTYIYEKLPMNISNIVQDYDMYVKFVLSFIIFYTLAYFQYI